MPIKIWPREYEKKEQINSGERYLLRNALRNFKDGSFVVEIDPIGLRTEKVRLGMYISPNEGLITFSIMSSNIDPTQIPVLIEMNKVAEKRIYERLLGSRALIVRHDNKKILKFPYKHIYIYPEESFPVTSCDEDTLLRFAPYAVVRFFMPIAAKNKPKYLKDLHIFDNIRMPYDSSFQRITDGEQLAIFERLAPEYTVVIKEKEEIDVPETRDSLPAESEAITGKEVEYKTFYLDDYQIGQINDMGRGHRVLLANAGAGKSVILLAKAFKYASMYKKSNILLTCYNSNLADSYKFKKQLAGITVETDRKLHIYTLHKLVAKLFKECIGRTIEGFANEEQIQECIDLVKSNQIKVRFKAIFIDEVQIFTPLYLELCYALLEKTDDNLFLMAGDLNQTVRSQSRRGDAPWKKINGIDLDFTGRVRYIEKNYRNSPEISKYLNRMLKYMNHYLSKMKMINIDEFAYDSFENGNNNNIALKVMTGIDRRNIKHSIVDAIHEITEKYHIGYSEIAILYPVRENKLLNYYIQYWIRTALTQEGIPYSFISAVDDEQRSSYSGSSGMIVSTIDSSLGLDFRAVILAGLYPFSYVFGENQGRTKLSSWSSIGELSDEKREAAQIQMRKLYTACSRAREVLYVLSDVEKGTVIEDIIKSGVGK